MAVPTWRRERNPRPGARSRRREGSESSSMQRLRKGLGEVGGEREVWGEELGWGEGDGVGEVGRRVR